MPFLGWLLIGIGVLLAYSSFQDRNPKDEVIAALRGDPAPGKNAFPIAPYKGEQGYIKSLGTTDEPPIGGRMGGSSVFVKPIPGSITSGFGMRSGRMHYGVDIPAPTGTPIKAAASGSVLTNAYDPGGAGYYITLRHSGGLYTKYFHMVRRSNLRIGSNVGAGEVIGQVGSTGRSSGPHLHFEVHEGGTGFGNSNAVDPKRYIT